MTDVLKSIDLEFGFELAGANIYGLRVGPLPIVVRTREGKLDIDVIDTSLNGGRIHLEPVLTLDREHGSKLRLDQSSSIANAEINDEVSRRFLSYVAPVLDRATRAHGRVSVDLQEAEFPIGGPAKREAKVEGQVMFKEVEFLPGPFADQLLVLIGRTDRPTIKLDQPVSLTIADRRVYQKGLALPLGQLTRVELEGWVDFDRNLQSTASLPITAAMVGNAPVLSALVENQRISVPIRGTLKNPEIDRDAMNLSLKNLGQSVLGNGMIRGAAEMFRQLQKPRDPNAPPPPTFQERRANRLERKAERRRQRGLEP
jgi:translocation and assembly module TamB